MQQAKAVFLTAYPDGMPTEKNFDLRNVAMPQAGKGEMLLRTVWMWVDPYMRGRMRPDVKSYIPPFSLDEPLQGGAVSEVMESSAEGFSKGDYVVGFQGGWKEYSISKPGDVQKVDPKLAPLSAYLGVLGMPGLTAWAGLTQILEPKEGVGSLVCQLAKLRGARVVGSAGSKAKCDWLTSKGGCDVALNYKDYKDAAALTKALAEAAPKGVDCYFENVGGDHLEAALNCINVNGRIALCGMISVYNNKTPTPGPANLVNLIGRSVKMEGFVISKFMHMAMQFIGEVAPQLAQGKIHFEETRYEGLDKAPEAFLGLFKGENFGKAVVRVGPYRL